MSKTRDELLSSVTELGTIEDGATLRAKLTALSDDVTALYDEHDTLKAANEKLDADNKQLKEYNMQLFLRVGGQQPKKEPEKTPQTEELKYENLFNEKGELK